MFLADNYTDSLMEYMEKQKEPLNVSESPDFQGRSYTTGFDTYEDYTDVLPDDNGVLEDEIFHPADAEGIPDAKDSVEMKKSKVLGNIVLGVLENPLQDIFMESMLDGVHFKTEVFHIEKDIDSKPLRKYRNESIFDEKMILKIIVEKNLSKELHDLLISLSLKNRLIFIQFKNEKTLDMFYKNLMYKYSNSSKVTRLPLAETYSDKKDLITSLLKTWNIAFDKPQTKDLLISLMITNPAMIDNARLSLSIYRESKAMVDMDFLDDVFEGVDHYNLDDWIVMVLRGIKPKKKMEILHYFLNRKGYPPAWLIEKIRESLLTMNKMYIAYAQGIIAHPIPSFALERRINHRNWENGTDIVLLKPKLQEEYLDFVKDVPYSYTVNLNRLVFDKSYNHATKEDIYRLMKEVNTLLVNYDAEKGFTNSRKLQEVIKYNAGKSRK